MAKPDDVIGFAGQTARQLKYCDCHVLSNVVSLHTVSTPSGSHKRSSLERQLQATNYSPSFLNTRFTLILPSCPREVLQPFVFPESVRQASALYFVSPSRSTQLRIRFALRTCEQKSTTEILSSCTHQRYELV